MSDPDCPTCNGQRSAIYEDIPTDALVHTPEHSVEVPADHRKLSADIMRRFGPPGAKLPGLVRIEPRESGVFGGRLLMRGPGIGYFAHDDAALERAVFLHEHGHYLRVFSGDTVGRHDLPFFVVAERLYRTYDVPLSTAKLVEGSWPKHWNW